MQQIEKPSATAIAEGFDELNSIFDATKYSITRCGCSQPIKPSRSFGITNRAATSASGALAQSFPPKAERGDDEH